MLRLSEFQHIEISTNQTRQLRGTASFIDLGNIADGENLLSNRGQTVIFALTDVSTATAIPRPTNPGSVRNVDFINVYNLSGVTAQCTISINSSGTTYPLKSEDINPAETLYWSPEAGYGIL